MLGHFNHRPVTRWSVYMGICRFWNSRLSVHCAAILKPECWSNLSGLHLILAYPSNEILPISTCRTFSFGLSLKALHCFELDLSHLAQLHREVAVAVKFHQVLNTYDMVKSYSKFQSFIMKCYIHLCTSPLPRPRCISSLYRL